jgi:hypothetical protein
MAYKTHSCASGLLHETSLPFMSFIYTVTKLPCPSCKQTDADKINALKRHACDFMGQQRSSDDDVQTSYLESTDNYKYATLAVARLIML